MTNSNSPDAFHAALAGRVTGTAHAPAISRRAITVKHAEIRLAVTRNPGASQFKSPLITGDELHFSASAWTTDTHRRIAIPTGELEAQLEQILGKEAVIHLLTFGDTIAPETGSVVTAHRFLFVTPDGTFYTPTPMQFTILNRAFGQKPGEPATPMGRLL